MSASAEKPQGFSALARHLVSYTALTLVTRALSFLLLPVYTRVMTPADYGILQLIEMTTDVAGIALVAGTTAGFQRFFLGAESQSERSVVVASTIGLLLAQAAVGGLALIVAAEPIARLVLKNANLAPLVVIAGVNFFVQAIPTVPLLLLQTLQKVRVFSVLTFSKAILQAGINVALLLLAGLGVRAFLYSTLTANLLLGLVLAIWTFRHYRPTWDLTTFRRIMKFGAPYRITTAGNFFLTFGDRFFLQANHGPAVVGLYGLSYQFGFLVSQLGEQPFLNAWLPQRFRHAKDDPIERNRLNALGALAFAIVLSTVAVGVAVSARPLVHLMTAASYADAALTVPVLAIAYVIACLTNAWKFGIDFSLQTRFFTYATWISVAVMLLAYAVLIPPYGAMGAAVATLIGFVARAIPTIIWAQRLFPLAYEWRRTARLFAAAVTASFLPSLLPVSGFAPMVAAAALTFSLYVTAVWFIVLDESNRQAVQALVGSSWQRWRA